MAREYKRYKSKVCPLLLLFAVTLLSSSLPHIASNAEAKEVSPPSHLGPKCLFFSSYTAWEERRRHWEQEIKSDLSKEMSNPFEWWSGKTSPPKSVISETRQQARCMVKALIHDLPRFGGKPKDIAELLELDGSLLNKKRAGLLSRSGFRAIFRSQHRSFKTQFYLWKKRGDFKKPLTAQEKKLASKLCKKEAINSDEHKWCIREEIYKARQDKVLLGTAPPAISRHHWGTEVDLFAVNRHKFRDRGALGPVYRWLKTNAHHFGFFQPYTKGNESGYIEERWHWSYGPVSIPILTVLRTENALFESYLHRIWQEAERTCAPRAPQVLPCLSRVEEVWRTRVYEIDESHPWVGNTSTR